MVQPQDHMVLVLVQTFVRRGPIVEFFGVIEGMGEKVSGFKPGDEVNGTADGIFADYVCVHCGSIRLAVHN